MKMLRYDTTVPGMAQHAQPSWWDYGSREGKSRIPGQLARILAAMAHREERGDHIKVILAYCSGAQQQYSAIAFYHRVKGTKTAAGTDEFRMPGTYHVRGYLTADEKQKIVSMFRAGYPQLRIAAELKRPISTVHYFLRRQGLLKVKNRKTEVVK